MTRLGAQVMYTDIIRLCRRCSRSRWTRTLIGGGESEARTASLSMTWSSSGSSTYRWALGKPICVCAADAHEDRLRCPSSLFSVNLAISSSRLQPRIKHSPIAASRAAICHISRRTSMPRIMVHHLRHPPRSAQAVRTAETVIDMPGGVCPNGTLLGIPLDYVLM